jgi:pyruvate,water dikinase
MDLIVDLSNAAAGGISIAGGKAQALSRLISAGFNVPPGICITTKAFRHYIEEGRLKEKILLETSRKKHDQMRWEEMWDSALRIRSLFQSTLLPQALRNDLASIIVERFGDRPVVVRSSSTVEDSGKASHAGLHESYLNVKGVEPILTHICLVWASLWSDASLLLIDETGQDMVADAMAVIVQELVEGEKSGVAFTVDPMEPGRGVIESVHGLNKGLVDGDVEPDRWIIRRVDGRIITHNQPVRDRSVRLSGQGVRFALAGELAGTPPLAPDEVIKVWRTVLDIEALFNTPQDVEWTFDDSGLFILQSRPITTIEPEKPARGSKAWNLTLKGSFGHLEELRNRIETVHFPRMEEEAARLADANLSEMDDEMLAMEIRRREIILKQWTDIYWDEFIPMAHGVRLFGRVYNDVMAPDDPFQFVELLRNTPMISTRRNALMEDLIKEVRADPKLSEFLKVGVVSPQHPEFQKRMELFLAEYGDLTWSGSRLSANLGPFLTFLVNMAEIPPLGAANQSERPDVDHMAEEFVNSYSDGPEEEARRMLDLARASWRLRDDDNIYLGRIEAQVQAAVEEGLHRLTVGGHRSAKTASPARVAAALGGTQMLPEEEAGEPTETFPDHIRARQIVGQPAGRGLACGAARVVAGFEDLGSFKEGEVLVCDSIDPNMTMLVPMACAIVERRGGMLIHGAIIAREAGIPCVNGVPDATQLIHTGDHVTVDGYLGLVVVHGRTETPERKSPKRPATPP